MERICKNCGYIDVSEIEACPVCKKNDWEDLSIHQIKDISTDESFVDAMIKLRNENPIEYQLKMRQLEIQQNQLKRTEQESSKLHCPYCNSVNVKKISGTERVASIALLGIFSKKINKSFKCNDCGGTF